MKGNKKILTIAILLLLVAVSFGTYAVYKSSASGSTTVSVASWGVEVNDVDIVSNNTFTGVDIAWGSNTYVKSGKIAPGSVGTITIEIDASGSEVAVDYAVTLGQIKYNDTAISNDAIVVRKASSSTAELSDTILYSSTASEMVKTITLEIVWNATDDSEQNPLDMDLSGKNLTIPVTVTATQKY